MNDLRDMIRLAAEVRASDVFIKSDTQPAMRIHGIIERIERFEKLTEADTREYAYSVMNAEQRATFELKHEMDLAFIVDGVSRVRANIYMQRGAVGIVCRLVPLKVYTIEDLGLPAPIGKMTLNRNGLVLVVGPTGSGKSTTLAAMINKINEDRKANIITVEDPIEFVHQDKQCIVSQREVGMDTDSFTSALKYILRQNPDVILVGELRDLETMNVALQASETGHLVFSTLHTASAAETLDRMINMFPLHEREMLCLRLANTLRGVVAQKLLPRADVPGRIAALEIMVVTPTIAKLIEDGKAGNVYGAIEEGDFWGMQTMNMCLTNYYKAGVINEEEALRASSSVAELKQMLRRPT